MADNPLERLLLVPFGSISMSEKQYLKDKVIIVAEVDDPMKCSISIDMSSEESTLLQAKRMTEQSYTPEIGEAFDKWHDYMIKARSINIPTIGEK